MRRSDERKPKRTTITNTTTLLRRLGLLLIVFVFAILHIFHLQHVKEHHFQQQREYDHSVAPHTGTSELRHTLVKLEQPQQQQQQQQRELINGSGVVWFGARFPNGTLGYKADPTLLQRKRRAFLLAHHFHQENYASQLQQQQQNNNEDPLEPALRTKTVDDDGRDVSSVNRGDADNDGMTFFVALEFYQAGRREGTWSANSTLDSASVCFPPGGSYSDFLEKKAGFSLLRKIEIANNNHSSTTSDSRNWNEAKTRTNLTEISMDNSEQTYPRILCAIYTHSHNRDLARAAALTWGYKCDGFLAFSTETITGLSFVNLIHMGEESYDNMWQKARSIWAYIAKHYLHDYDYFHLSGDDVFIITENLKHFLLQAEKRYDPNRPMFFGQWSVLSDFHVASRGPGYTLNRFALQRLVNETLPTCRTFAKVADDVRTISTCLRNIDIVPIDTRDYETGEQIYHNLDPNNLYFLQPGTRFADDQMMAFWEKFPHPSKAAQIMGRKTGLDAASRYSVVFHSIRHPFLMARMHAILYRSCPRDSNLGKSLSSELESVDSLSSQQPPIIFGARNEKGDLWYIADPTRLRQSLRTFEKMLLRKSVKSSLFMIFNTYERESLDKSAERISSPLVCDTHAGGNGLEGSGFALLKEKIRIDNLTGTEKTNSTSSSSSSSGPRIFCGMYSHQKQRTLARAAALTWGRKCDGFLIFTTETIPNLGMVDLIHKGDESYNNMWQKVRSIWAYIYENYLQDYDFFHLGGDDMYVIVENMRRFLSLVNERTNSTNPLLLGAWMPTAAKPTVGGGPGYTLNKAALKRLVEEVLPTCYSNKIVYAEDRMISYCFRDIKVFPRDTRDYLTGEQQYHFVDPKELYESYVGQNKMSFQKKQIEYYATLPHPMNQNILIGSKPKLEAAATYSVAFHRINSASYMIRLHSILYQMCPVGSLLARSLQ